MVTRIKSVIRSAKALYGIGEKLTVGTYLRRWKAHDAFSQLSFKKNVSELLIYVCNMSIQTTLLHI